MLLTAKYSMIASLRNLSVIITLDFMNVNSVENKFVQMIFMRLLFVPYKG